LYYKRPSIAARRKAPALDCQAHIGEKGHMHARDIHHREADFLSQKPRLGEKFAWAVLDREKPAANDCCIREKSEIRVRLASGKLFPGQYFDQETGFYYNHFRTYNPATGRYLESDPIGLQGGLNTYTYVLNNPLMLVDYYGLAETSGKFFDYYLTNVNVVSVTLKSKYRFENGKEYIGDYHVRGSVSADVTIECKDEECGETKYRYITQGFGTPEYTVKVPVVDNPLSVLSGLPGYGTAVSVAGYFDKAMAAGELVNKYNEIVNHKYTKAASTLICKMFPDRNDGIPYHVGTAP
jgi:RHS repeat-associated protein